MKDKHITPFLFLLFLLFIRPFHASAWKNYLPGGRSLALAHASVSFSDTWSVFHNQAGMARLKILSAGFYFESKYRLKELSLAAVSAILPTGPGAFGISMMQFGRGTYKENKCGLAYARQIAENWYAGIQLDYLSQVFPENTRNMGVATLEGGMLFLPGNNLHLGIHLFNPVFRSICGPSGTVKVPAVFRAGGHYNFHQNVRVAMEILHNTQHPVLFKSGIEFSPAKNFILRFGTSGKPFTWFAGLGIHSGRISADIAFSSHDHLGITPALSVRFSPHKKP